MVSIFPIKKFPTDEISKSTNSIYKEKIKKKNGIKSTKFRCCCSSSYSLLLSRPWSRAEQSRAWEALICFNKGHVTHSRDLIVRLLSHLFFLALSLAHLSFYLTDFLAGEWVGGQAAMNKDSVQNSLSLSLSLSLWMSPNSWCIKRHEWSENLFHPSPSLTPSSPPHLLLSRVDFIFFLCVVFLFLLLSCIAGYLCMDQNVKKQKKRVDCNWVWGW